MSIFNNFFQETENITAPAVLEGYGFESDAHHTIAMETYHDLLKVMEAAHRFDVSGTYVSNVLESTGDEDDEEAEEVMEAASKGFFEKIKKFFQNLWQRIRSFFDNMIRTFDSYTKSAEDFLKKYDKEIRRKDTTGLEMDLVRFKNLEASKLKGMSDDGISVRLESGYDAVKKYLEDDEAKKDAVSQARGALVGKSSVDPEDFQEELFSYFHEGKDKADATETGVKVDVAKAINEINQTKDLTKAIDKAKKEVDKNFSNLLKEVSKKEKEVSKVDLSKKNDSGSYGGGAKTYGSTDEVRDTTRYLQLISTEVSEKQSVYISYVNAFAKAFKERNSQNLSVLRRVLSYKRKEN